MPIKIQVMKNNRGEDTYVCKLGFYHQKNALGKEHFVFAINRNGTWGMRGGKLYINRNNEEALNHSPTFDSVKKQYASARKFGIWNDPTFLMSSGDWDEKDYANAEAQELSGMLEAMKQANEEKRQAIQAARKPRRL